MMRHRHRYPVQLNAAARALLIGLLALATSSVAHAARTLEITPNSFEAGDVVEVTISGFSPGGYNGTLNVDGNPAASFYIPHSGTRTFSWVTPVSLTPGGHDVVVCASCGQGDLEERTNTVRVLVTDGSLSGSEFNLQVWGIEITQGVRGDFAVRTPPAGSLVFPPEDLVHVANRRTVVRVYPWLASGPYITNVHNVKAHLWVSRDGTTYGPIEAEVPRISVNRWATMTDLRSDIARTWNFVLPDAAVRVFSTEGGTFHLTVTINPPGADRVGECTTCFDDNNAYLNGNDVVWVGTGPTPGAFRFRPHMVQADVDQPDGTVLPIPRPTTDHLAGALRGIQDVMPIGDGFRGVFMMPSRDVYWRGTPAGWDPVQDEYLIRNFLPGGELREAPPHDYYAFLYWPGGCAGHAFTFSPFVRTSADAPPCLAPAHELNHAIGAEHAGNGHGEGDGGGYDPFYPGTHGQVEANTWGMNVYDFRVYPPASASSFTHDFMSYGPAPMWTSRYTWNLTAQNLGAPAIDPGSRPLALTAAADDPSPDPMTFHGIADGSGVVDLSPFFLTWNPDGGQGDGTHVLEFRDSGGGLLASHLLRPVVAQDLSDYPLMFSESVVPPAGWRRMAYRKGGAEVQSWTRSVSVPTAVITSPAPGFQWPNHGTRTLVWDGSDSDGDLLHYRVLAQHGPTGEVCVVASDLTAETFDLDLSQLPAGGDWSVAVEVSDGFDHTFSSIVSGTVDPKRPQALIVRPATGSVHVKGSDVPAIGLVADIQGPISDVNLAWYLDGQFVDNGTSIELPNVVTGNHVLSLIAYNAYQLADTTEVLFKVVSALTPPDLVAPPDGAQLPPESIPLDWSSSEGAISYRVQFASDPGFGKVVAEFGNLGESEFSFGTGQEGVTLYWRAMAEHGTSPSGWSLGRSFTIGTTTSVGEPGLSAELSVAMYPNPLRTSSTISYRLAQAGRATVSVFDITGRRVRSLAAGHHSSGSHAIAWDGTDDGGRALGAGVYLVRVTTPAGATDKRVLIVR